MCGICISLFPLSASGSGGSASSSAENASFMRMKPVSEVHPLVCKCSEISASESESMSPPLKESMRGDEEMESEQCQGHSLKPLEGGGEAGGHCGMSMAVSAWAAGDPCRKQSELSDDSRSGNSGSVWEAVSLWQCAEA